MNKMHIILAVVLCVCVGATARHKKENSPPAFQPLVSEDSEETCQHQATRRPQIDVGFGGDLTSAVDPGVLSVVVYRRSFRPDTDFSGLQNSIVLQTWPELEAVPAAVLREDDVSKTGPVAARLRVKPVDGLQSRWYVLTATAGSVFQWEEGTVGTLVDASVGTMTFRFRPDSSPTAARVKIRDKLEPDLSLEGNAKNRKPMTAFDLTFSEPVAVPSDPGELASMLSVKHPSMSRCQVTSPRAVGQPTKTLRLLCYGQLRGRFELSVNGPGSHRGASKGPISRVSDQESLADCGPGCKSVELN
jgi:hypothetical protein